MRGKQHEHEVYGKKQHDDQSDDTQGEVQQQEGGEETECSDESRKCGHTNRREHRGQEERWETK